MSGVSMSGELTARTRELIESISQMSQINEGWKPATCFEARKAAAESPRVAIDTLTPRLMELLAGEEPQRTEVEAVHAGLASLESTLGAAYMLLAAEAKAETLEAEVALAGQRLNDRLTADDGLREAHARCVGDYGELRTIMDDTRRLAEQLARDVAEGKPPGRSVQALLEALGSKVQFDSLGPGSSALSNDENCAPPNADSSLTALLREAEDNQRFFAASLHSREAQLDLARSELDAVEQERMRYVGIVSEASEKLATAANAPGDRTSRSVGRRAETAARRAEEEEERLMACLDDGAKVVAEWMAADRASSHHHSEGGGGKRGDGGGGGRHAQPPHGAPATAIDGSSSTPAKRERRKSKRHAAAEEVRRTLNRAGKEAQALRRRREEMRGIMGSLRDMLGALELERAARIQLQEKLARDFTLQRAALKRCVYEQDVLLEVALHKLELAGGGALVAALSSQLTRLRAMNATIHAEGDGAEGEGGGATKRRAGGWDKGRVPEALNTALTSIHKFLLGHVQAAAPSAEQHGLQAAASSIDPSAEQGSARWSGDQPAPHPAADAVPHATARVNSSRPGSTQADADNLQFSRAPPPPPTPLFRSPLAGEMFRSPLAEIASPLVGASTAFLGWTSRDAGQGPGAKDHGLGWTSRDAAGQPTAAQEAWGEAWGGARGQEPREQPVGAAPDAEQPRGQGPRAAAEGTGQGPRAPDVERVGAMAKSVLEHLHGRLSAAAKQAVA